MTFYVYILQVFRCKIFYWNSS